MKTPEDEEFERVDRESGWRKRQIALDQKAENAKELGLDYELEPVGKLQEPTAERSWFTIAELNAWADKKLSENPHWVMPKDEPERDEPPPQRPWVGLTDEEIDQGLLRSNHALQTAGAWRDGVEWATKQLKEKNT